MRKLMFASLAAAAFSMTACSETTKEETGEAAEAVVDDAAAGAEAAGDAMAEGAEAAAAAAGDAAAEAKEGAATAIDAAGDAAKEAAAEIKQ